MVKIVNDVVTWLKQWFYTEDEIDTKVQGLQSQINNKAETLTVTSLTNTVNSKADKTGGVAQVTDANANNYTNIGVIPANSSQQSINGAINEAIGNLKSIKAIQIVSTLPTASSSTMNRLYVVSENNKINVYYTEQNGSSYSWHKMDSDILDELSIDWSDVLNNPFSNNTPSDFATASHKHGRITNNGQLLTGSQLPHSNVILVTDSNGIIQGITTISTAKIQSPNAYPYIGTDVLATQDTINTAIDTALGSKLDTTAFIWENMGNKPSFAPPVHYHDTNYILSNGALSFLNIGISDSQTEINEAVDTALSNCITSIELVPKTDDNTGAIKLYYGDEPSNNS